MLACAKLTSRLDNSVRFVYLVKNTLRDLILIDMCVSFKSS